MRILAIHEGVGASGRFIEVQLRRVAAELIESELSGMKKVLSMERRDAKIGLFEQANGGTNISRRNCRLPPICKSNC